MGLVDDRLRGAVSRSSVQTFAGVDKEGLPELSELMAGRIGKSGVEWERWPYSLLLYLDGPVVKFKLGSGDERPSIWGTIDGLAAGLEGVEAALCKGHFSTKPAQGKDNGFTHRTR